MNKRRTGTAKGISGRIVSAFTHNFTLKLISLTLAIVIYLFLKKDAQNQTPALKAVAKAVAEGAVIETTPEPAGTNDVVEASAPAETSTNTTESAASNPTKAVEPKKDGNN